jgi:hypothetical protein
MHHEYFEARYLPAAACAREAAAAAAEEAAGVRAATRSATVADQGG